MALALYLVSILLIFAGALRGINSDYISMLYLGICGVLYLVVASVLEISYKYTDIGKKEDEKHEQQEESRRAK